MCVCQPDTGALPPSLVVLDIFILVSINQEQWPLRCVDRLGRRRKSISPPSESRGLQANGVNAHSERVSVL